MLREEVEQVKQLVTEFVKVALSDQTKIIRGLEKKIKALEIKISDLAAVVAKYKPASKSLSKKH